MRGVVVRVVCVFAGCTASLAAQDAAVHVDRVGANVQLRVHPGELPGDVAERLADDALAALERAWPDVLKIVKPKATEPLVVQLHAGARTFRPAEQRLRADAVPLEVAVAPRGQEAHVLLWPALSERALRNIGLPRATGQNLVYALAKQVVQRELGERADDWAGDIVALGVLELHVNPKRGGGVDPYYDGRRVAAFVDHRDGKGVMALQGVLADALSPGDRASFVSRSEGRALLAEQLSQKTSTWAQTLMRNLKGPRDGVVFVEDRQKAVEAVLGRKWDRTQQRFEKSVAGFAPRWMCSQPEAWEDADGWRLVGEQVSHAHLYNVHPLPDGDYRIRFVAEVEPSEQADSFRVLLDWNGKDVLAVAFDYPSLCLRRWGDDRWHQLAGEDLGLSPGRPMAVAIEWVGGELVVTVGAREALRQRLPRRSMHGHWGFATGDALVTVRDLGVEPLGGRSGRRGD